MRIGSLYIGWEALDEHERIALGLPPIVGGWEGLHIEWRDAGIIVMARPRNRRTKRGQPMTTDRRMSLQEIKDALERFMRGHADAMGSDSLCNCIASLDAHLRAGQPVAWMNMSHGSTLTAAQIGAIPEPPHPHAYFKDGYTTPLYLHPSEDARDARLLRALIRRRDDREWIMTTKAGPHDIVLRIRIEPDEELFRDDGTLDFANSIRNALEAECVIQSAASAEESGNG